MDIITVEEVGKTLIIAVKTDVIFTLSSVLLTPSCRSFDLI